MQASFYELFTGPATQILNRWFEGDVLKATLATDAVIGSMAAPSDPGSAYVLLHHVMGEAAGALDRRCTFLPFLPSPPPFMFSPFLLFLHICSCIYVMGLMS